MNEERWLPVPIGEFADHYEVSDYGRVRRISRTRGTYPGKILSQRISGKRNAYPRVILTLNYATLEIKVHRLVALAFIGQPPSSRHEVAHWDGNPANSYWENLRWATRRENREDMRRHDTLGHKLTQKIADEIRLAEGPQTYIASKYGISQSMVSEIKIGKAWMQARAG